MSIMFKKIKIFPFLFLFFCTVCHASIGNIEELDGSPSLYPWKLKVTNGTLTDNGDGTATLTISAGGFSNPMTTLGDIIYENVTPTAARLAGNITTTKQYLSQTGNGAVSAAPAWAQIALADLATFSSATLATALTDETGTGVVMFDTSPKLLTSLLDTNGNTLLGVTATGSAVNWLTLADQATGVNPSLTASGETNVGINLITKGTGGVVITSSATATQSTINSGLVVNNASTNNAADSFIAQGNGLTLFKADPTTNTITAMGQVSNYAAIALVHKGIPSSVANSDLTAQSAAITATTLYAVPATGWYRITWSATITTAASTSSSLGGSTGLQVKYTSPTDSVVKTDNQTSADISAGNTTGTSISGIDVAYCKTGTNLQYLFGYTSVGVTAMVYELHITVEVM